MAIQRLNDLTIKQLSNLLTYKFHLLIFLLSLSILTRFNIDPDLGWHLAIGNKFLEQGEIIRGDQFSWTMSGYFWGNSYFLYQIVAAFLFKNFNLIFIGIFFSFIVGLATLILLPKKLKFETVLLVGLGIGIATANLAIRPHVFDFLFFSVLLVILEKQLFRRKIFLPLWFGFFALWANFHLGFLVGLVVMSAFVLIKSTQQLLIGKKLAALVPGFLAILAAFLGTFLTPFHFYVWKSLILDSGGPSAWVYINEFLPVVFFTPLNIIYALSGLIFVYFFYKNFRRLDPAWFLISAFIFMLPFLTVYFAFFWSAMFIFISSRFFTFKLPEKTNFLEKMPIYFALVAASLALFLSFLVRILETGSLENRLKKDGYPVEAANFLREKGLTNNVLNDYGWGGYLDWQLPEARVFIDGRMAGWRIGKDKYILNEYLKIIKGNCEVAKEYEIKTLLVKSNWKLSCFKDWNVAYEDNTAKVLVKP